MIENCIFDFGNVLANFYPEDLTRPFIDNENELNIIKDVVFDRIYWDRLDEGTITDKEVKTAIKSRLPNDLHEKAIKVYDSWIDTMTPVEGMQKLISDIKNSGKKLYLISNISIKFANEYKNVKWIADLFANFDGLVFSSEIKKTKPSKEIFDYLFSTYSLNANECIFIDDNKDNVEGAKKLGIQGYLFDRDVNKLREHLGI